MNNDNKKTMFQHTIKIYKEIQIKFKSIKIVLI